MNFGDLFRNRRVRSKTFSGAVKAKEPRSSKARSSSDTTCEVPDVLNSEESRTSLDSEPTTRAAQPANGGGSKPRISASVQNLGATDSANIQSSHGEIRLQTSDSLGARKRDVSSPEETLPCAVDESVGFWRSNSTGLKRKSLSTSNIFVASTQRVKYPVEFDLNVSAMSPSVQTGMQNLFTRPKSEKVNAALEKTSSRRRISLVKETELHTAISCDNDREVCTLLDEQRLDPNETCKNALTPLHRAAIEGSYRCLKVLLLRGADINARDLEGWTPLHDAVFHGHVRCALALLIAGADVEAETFEFVKPIEMAEDDDMVLIIGRAMTMYHDGLLSKPDRETLV